MNAALFLLLFGAAATSVSPNASTIALNASQPAVSYAPPTGAVAPNAAAIVIAASSPVVTYTPASYNVSPSKASLASTASQPVVSFAPVGTIAPANASLLLSASSPTVVSNPLLTPNAASLGLSVSSPVVSFTPKIAPLSAALALAASQPVVAFVPAAGIVNPNSVQIGLSVSPPVVFFIGHAAPISVADAKTYLKVDTDDDDDLITGLIDGAAGYFESAHGIVCAPRAHDFAFDAYQRQVQLLRYPVRGIDAINYVDPDGNDEPIYDWSFRTTGTTPTLTLSAEGYYAAAQSPLTVTAQIGWASNADIPPVVRVAAMTLIASWYGQREVGEVPPSVDQMLWAYRPGSL